MPHLAYNSKTREIVAIGVTLEHTQAIARRVCGRAGFRVLPCTRALYNRVASGCGTQWVEKNGKAGLP